ncbi:MAG: riboflavin synthase [Cyclobacteriaceae bacterium]
MFTGIIESLGQISSIRNDGTNVIFEVSSPISSQLKVDQSLAHDGVCLTVVKVVSNTHSVVAVQETLDKTGLRQWQVGRKVNLERSMPAHGRFDGHVVQGHVDQIARVESVTDLGGSWCYDFSYDAGTGNLTVEKGSVCVNGTSLTCFNCGPGKFTVAIIPYTYEHTNFHQMKAGDVVNLEFDIIGKYVQAMLARSGRL